MFKILDCTLRDGGYYTNWDFSPEVIDAYIQAMNQLPIDYLEIGYRNIPKIGLFTRFSFETFTCDVCKKTRCNVK